MSDKQIIVPQILKGTREFGPADMAKRNFVMKKIVEVFERFGYDPIETPILNPAETILGKYGEEGDRLTYNWLDAGERRIALPYDLTVPFARYVAANWRDLPMPFKRYQIQRVWRAEKPQKGRLREFYQCDIDIIGTKSLLADTEVAKVIVEVFNAIGLPEVIIKINSRRLLDAVLERFNIPQDKRFGAIRVIDKLDKIGREKVIEALRQEGIGQAEELMELLAPGQTNEETLEKLNVFDLTEIKKFFEYCRAYQIPDASLQFDPTLARGLDYYTGIIFEVVGKETGIGTLCAGGRYDDLCSLFTDQSFSGMGVAFGFERMMMVLEEKGKLQDIGLATNVLVANFGDMTMQNTLAIMRDLTEAGINTELYFESSKLEKQFKYADKKQIPFVVMCGSEELSRGEVKIKIMAVGKQKSIPQNQLVSYVKGYAP